MAKSPRRLCNERPCVIASSNDLQLAFCLNLYIQLPASKNRYLNRIHFKKTMGESHSGQPLLNIIFIFNIDTNAEIIVCKHTFIVILVKSVVPYQGT